jgi:hypothetical protein
VSVSTTFKQAAYAQETGRVIIALITIDHSSLLDPIRICTNPTERLQEFENDIIYGTVSRGNNYVFLPFSLQIPSDTDEGPGNMTIEFDNVHRTYTEAIRSIFTPPTVTVELVLDSDPDTVEVSWPEFLLTDITYNALTIQGTLSLELLDREPFPSGTFNPSSFPGLF